LQNFVRVIQKHRRQWKFSETEFDARLPDGRNRNKSLICRRGERASGGISEAGMVIHSPNKGMRIEQQPH
jgi:hypothetical protein